MSIKKEIILELKYKEAAKNADELGKIVQEQDKKIASLQNTLDDVKKSTDKSSKGFKGFGASLKAIGKVTGIVFLITEAFEILKETLGKNQKVVDAFKIGTEALSIAFNDFFNFISNNIGTVVDFFQKIFENPKQSLIDFGNAIKANLIERFNSFLETLGYIASAVKKVFSGDFTGALEDVKNAGKEYVDVFTGVDGSFDKIVDGAKVAGEAIKKYAKETIKTASANVELNKQAELAAVINQGLIEKYDRQAERLRWVRDDETKTIEERLKANKELGDVLDEQEKAMLKNAKLSEDAAFAQLQKNKDNIEYQKAYQEALNETAAIEAQIDGFRSEQKQNQISLEKELAEQLKEAAELAQEEYEAELERQKRIKELTQGELSPYEKLAQEREAKLAELDLLKATEEEKQKIRDQYAELELQLDKATQEAKLQTISQALNGVAALVGENTAAGKAIAIAQATIDTYVAANKALAQGGIFGAISAAGIIAGGLANVKTIASTKIPNAPSAGVGASAPQAPAFNIVGASPENQLAQAIGDQERKPVKAYVVGDDVTNQQALDRKISQGASIG